MYIVIYGLQHNFNCYLRNYAIHIFIQNLLLFMKFRQQIGLSTTINTALLGTAGIPRRGPNICLLGEEETPLSQDPFCTGITTMYT